MLTEKTKKTISELPDVPGVYKFLRGKKVLYVGKATSLRDRVRSYFTQDMMITRGPLIVKMLSQFDSIDYIKTDSVLEALILEANLIKKYQPEGNVKDKDNKSFNFVIITKEDFPRVLVMRERELKNTFSEPFLHSFGPFTNGGQLREAMKIIRKLFPYRDKCIPFQDLKSNKQQLPRPCFNRQIGLCPGVCTGEVTKAEYAKTIKNIILLFRGNKRKIKRNLETQMRQYAKTREFEKASKIKKTIFALNHIQDVALIRPAEGALLHGGFRIESYDIAHMSGQNVVGVMTVLENGEIKRSDYRKFNIKEDPGVNDIKALSEVLTRRLGHIEWPLPDLIVVDGGKAQINFMEKIIKQNFLKIPVFSVVKDEHHRPKEILGERTLLITNGHNWPDLESQILLANSEAHRFAITFHKQKRSKL